MNKVALGVLSASLIGTGILLYLKKLKIKIKGYVLRNENIEKYFKGER